MPSARAVQAVLAALMGSAKKAVRQVLAWVDLSSSSYFGATALRRYE